MREYMTTPDGADSDIRSGGTMIDIVDALDLLNGCVQERGESWLPARDESSPSASLRYEAGRPVMDGMVRSPVRPRQRTRRGRMAYRGGLTSSHSNGLS